MRIEASHSVAHPNFRFALSQLPSRPTGSEPSRQRSFLSSEPSVPLPGAEPSASRAAVAYSRPRVPKPAGTRISRSALAIDADEALELIKA